MAIESDPSNPPRKISSLSWVFIAVVLGLNFWIDYYHPLGWFFDVIILAALAIRADRKSQK